MELKTILFITHTKAQCGIYEFGINIFDVLEKSSEYNFVKVECSSLQELENTIAQFSPQAILYNYHPSVLPWVANKISPRLFRNNIASINLPQIGIIHEITQTIADNATSYQQKYFTGQKRSVK